MENENLNGDQGTPSPDPSGQSNQTSAVDYNAIATALEPVITKAVERQWQSGKDKRIADLTGKVDGFQERLEKYLKYAGVPEINQQALRDMQIDELLAGNVGEPTAKGAGSAETVGNGSPNVKPSVDVETLEALGLDPSSAEVKTLLDKDANIEEYVALLKRRKSKTTNPAMVMPSGGSGTVTGESLDDLDAQLTVLYRNPVQNQKRIKELLEKQRELLGQ